MECFYRTVGFGASTTNQGGIRQLGGTSKGADILFHLGGNRLRSMSNSMSGAGPCRILVVEDEPVLAMLLQDALRDMGCEVVVAHAVSQARQLAEIEDVACGFLDIKIGNDTVVPVADALSQRNIPFVFSSNYGRELLPQRYRNHIMLPKPYFPDDIAHVFRTQLNIRLGSATPYR